MAQNHDEPNLRPRKVTIPRSFLSSAFANMKNGIKMIAPEENKKLQKQVRNPIQVHRPEIRVTGGYPMERQGGRRGEVGGTRLSAPPLTRLPPLHIPCEENGKCRHYTLVAEGVTEAWPVKQDREEPPSSQKQGAFARNLKSILDDFEKRLLRAHQQEKRVIVQQERDDRGVLERGAAELGSYPESSASSVDPVQGWIANVFKSHPTPPTDVEGENHAVQDCHSPVSQDNHAAEEEPLWMRLRRERHALPSPVESTTSSEETLDSSTKTEPFPAFDENYGCPFDDAPVASERHAQPSPVNSTTSSKDTTTKIVMQALENVFQTEKFPEFDWNYGCPFDDAPTITVSDHDAQTSTMEKFQEQRSPHLSQAELDDEYSFTQTPPQFYLGGIRPIPRYEAEPEAQESRQWSTMICKAVDEHIVPPRGPTVRIVPRIVPREDPKRFQAHGLHGAMMVRPPPGSEIRQSRPIYPDNEHTRQIHVLGEHD